MNEKDFNPEMYGRGFYFFHDIPIQHTPAELSFLDMFLTKNKFDTIIEIGTLHGGLTILFGIHALRTNSKVLTLDIREEPKGFYKQMASFLPITFHQKSILEDQTTSSIKQQIATGGRTLIYCDGGYKKIEFNLYAPFLKPGDVIVAHDKVIRFRDNEIFFSDIKDTVEKHGLEPMHEYILERYRSRMFMFLRTYKNYKKPKEVIKK